MPANVAHMLIAHKALQWLQKSELMKCNEFAEYIRMLNDLEEFRNKRYVNLGSLGPDLFYYGDIVRSARDVLVDRFVQAKGITAWSYHLHSYRPNEFPLRLIEIVFRDVVRVEETRTGSSKSADLHADDKRKISYIAGHLSHIAADQIIHPVVNRVAGPYYRSGVNRQKHRECEVFQDCFLYEEVYRIEDKQGPRYEFGKQKFHEWIDCVTDGRDWREWLSYVVRKGFFLKYNVQTAFRVAKRIGCQNTHDWFRYFIQRGFVENYGASPSEELVEDAVDNLQLTLWICKRTGPYRKAAREYRRDKHRSEMYCEYVKGTHVDLNYMGQYRLAVRLAAVYLIALYEAYLVLSRGGDFKEKHKRRFRSIVSSADLSCPLEKGIFDRARDSLKSEENMDSVVKTTHLLDSLKKTKFQTEKEILESDVKGDERAELEGQPSGCTNEGVTSGE